MAKVTDKNSDLFKAQSTMVKSYNSDWIPKGFAAVGDATPAATLNHLYFPTENGTIFGQTVSDYTNQVLVGDGSAFGVENIDELALAKSVSYSYYTNKATGNKFVKEVYIYGSGLDLENKIYWISLVCRENETYGSGLIIIESDADFTNQVTIVQQLNKTEADFTGLCHIDSDVKDISFDFIFNWETFELGTNTSGTTLQYVFNELAFDVNYSPRIFSYYQNLDTLSLQASKTDIDLYINDAKIISEGEAGDDSYSQKGVGTCVQINEYCYINRIAIKASSTTYESTVKIYKTDSEPVSGTNPTTSYELIGEGVIPITSDVDEATEIDFTLTKVNPGEWIVVLCAIVTISSNTTIKRYSTDISGRDGLFFNTSADYANIFNTSWSKAGVAGIYSLVKPEVSIVKISNIPEIIELQEDVALLQSGKRDNFTPRITIPSVIFAVVGTQLNLYYDAMVLAIDRGIQSPANCSVKVNCEIGFGRERNFQLTAVADDIGNHDFEVIVYDDNKNIIESKTVILTVISSSAPAATSNILMVGDSTLNNGPVTSTVYDNFNNLGSNVPTFRGSKGTSPAVHLGVPGWSYQRFATAANTRYVFQIPSSTSVDVSSEYTHNSSTYYIHEVFLIDGAGYINCEKISGTNDPLTSGTLTKVDGGGDVTLSFSSWDTQPDNPLWNGTTAQLDISNYRTNIGMGSTLFDVVSIRLGINESFGTEKDEANRLGVIQYAKDLIDAFLADNASTKIIIELPTTDGSTRGGWAENYGSDNPKEDYQLNVWRLRELILDEFDESAYSVNVEVCASGIAVDRFYGYARSSTQIADRIAINENWHTNAVHPTTEGYYQLADIIFPHILKFLQ